MEELTRGIVFRLATLKDTFPPDSQRLHYGHFELSENDKKHIPPMLSVFDGSLTRVTEAQEIRGVAAASMAFGIKAEAIKEVQLQAFPRLKLVRDPLDFPESALPGAEGHCGILGLDRQAGETKTLYRELRVRLADLTFRYTDSAGS